MYSYTIDKANKMELILSDGELIFALPVGTILTTLKNTEGICSDVEIRNDAERFGEIKYEHIAINSTDFKISEYVSFLRRHSDYKYNSITYNYLDVDDMVDEWLKRQTLETQLNEAYENEALFSGLNLIISTDDFLFNWFDSNIEKIFNHSLNLLKEYDDLLTIVSELIGGKSVCLLYDERRYMVIPRDYLDGNNNSDTYNSLLIILSTAAMRHTQECYNLKLTEDIIENSNISFLVTPYKQIPFIKSDAEESYYAKSEERLKESSFLLNKLYSMIRSDELTRKLSYLQVNESNGISKRGIFGYIEGANKVLFSQSDCYDDCIDFEPWVSKNCFSTDDINLLSLVNYTPSSFSITNIFLMLEKDFINKYPKAQKGLCELEKVLPSIVEDISRSIININYIQNIIDNIKHYSELIYEFLFTAKESGMDDYQLAEHALIALMIPGSSCLPPLLELHHSGDFEKGFCLLIQSISNISDKEIYTNYQAFTDSIYLNLKVILKRAYINFIASCVENLDKYKENIFIKAYKGLSDNNYVTYYFESMEFLHVILKKAQDENKPYFNFRECTCCGLIYNPVSNNQKLCDTCHDHYNNILPNRAIPQKLNEKSTTAKRQIKNMRKNLSVCDINDSNFYILGYLLRRIYALAYLSHPVYGKDLRNYWFRFAPEKYDECLKSIDRFFTDNTPGDKHEYNRKVDYKQKNLHFPIIVLVEKGIFIDYDVPVEERIFEICKIILDYDEKTNDASKETEFVSIKTICDRFNKEASKLEGSIISQLVGGIVKYSEKKEKEEDRER